MNIKNYTSLPSRTKERYTYISFDLTRDHSLFERAGNSSSLSIGIQNLNPLNRRRVIALSRTIVREAKKVQLKHIAIQIDDLEKIPGYGKGAEDSYRLIAENLHMAGYEFTALKTPKKDSYMGIEEVAFIGTLTAKQRKDVAVGETVAHEVNACRDLANMPGGDMTPTFLANEVRKRCKGTGITVQVLDKKAMEKLKMGAVLGVAKGAQEEPKFIIAEYWGTSRTKAPVVLVGKGVTFDTGGLSLKPADYMLDMHLDMSGGSAVIHALIAAARLGLKVNVVVLIPAVENAISGESYRPGDVLRSMSGKTIDILNTDAEGRVVMADALTYARRYKPVLTVDVATLTGASLVALGTKASAVLSTDDELAQRVVRLGETSGDHCWQLPLWEEYKEMVKGRFGDIANMSMKSGRYGGAIAGGMFLAEFAKDLTWVHIDMAPRMISDDSDLLASGAAGAPVRLLVRLLEEQAGV
jgi:leucyl aminopeptidase